MRMPLLHEAVVEHDDGRALKYVAEVRQAIGEAHACLREIIDEFRAPVDPHGLVHALQACVDTFRERSGLQIEFVNRFPGLSLSAAQEAQAVPVVREALANVAKHALASNVRLTLEGRGGDVVIEVEDDGTGLAIAGPTATRAAHHGVHIMRERARRLGGGLDLDARQGRGTLVRLKFPLHPPAASLCRPS
jgi:two-component system nitrate/nitrite sensor histidine kinase NarX